MDKNQAIGLVLIALLFIVYFKFFAPTPPVDQPQELVEQEEVTKPVEEAQTEDITPSVSPADTINPMNQDSLAGIENQRRYGMFAQAAQGEAQEFTLENNLIKIIFSNQGGKIKKVELKNFKTYEKEPLILINEQSSRFSFLLNVENKEIDLTQLFFEADQITEVASEGDTAKIVFRLNLAGNRSLVQTYQLAPDAYQLKYAINTEGLEGMLNEDHLVYHWINDIKLLEKNVEESRYKTTITYFTAEGSFEDLKERSLDPEQEEITAPIKWVAMKQKFFTSAIIADDYFSQGFIKTTVNPMDSSTVKKAEMLLNIPLANLDAQEYDFTYYFGPNNYQILKKVTDGFSKNVYLGWTPVNMVNKFLIIPIFHFLERFTSNYGLIIFLLVIIIRLILSPLSYKSYISMAKTKILKPELDTLKEEYGNDMQKIQSEQMKLYQKAGVNPLSGCVPMLLQMPILFAMFYFFPNSIELRQESFLWADDLSTYDSIISWNANIPILSSLYGNHISLFTLLMTVSTILYTWSNNQVSSVQGPMKSFGYLMPIIFMFVLNKFSAALTYYYFLSNIFTFGQQALIRKFVDEDKIKAIMEDNKLRSKSKKKSKFQLRLEEAMKTANDDKKTKPGRK
ncbi:MAG: membrane protein insertase YidC [Candidatus Cyclobacteriaceae bacterium M3_2C_046]